MWGTQVQVLLTYWVHKGETVKLLPPLASTKIQKDMETRCRISFNIPSTMLVSCESFSDRLWGMQVQVLLTYWEHKYCQLEHDCAEAKAQNAGPKELLSFEVDMKRLAILTEDVLSENAQENVKFLSVHCTPLKQVLPLVPCQRSTGHVASLAQVLYQGGSSCAGSQQSAPCAPHPAPGNSTP